MGEVLRNHAVLQKPLHERLLGWSQALFRARRLKRELGLHDGMPGKYVVLTNGQSIALDAGAAFEGTTLVVVVDADGGKTKNFRVSEIERFGSKLDYY
ncbi:MAG: hypothetical protein KC877_02165 [Candidatus Kaiserbacteria bacterium]|nr:hypothetical protein [Candidatus Kaiserbacteria bacterium]MCB9816170.1 hypothetical protein [Candidatus Nomurabacteria bacterium]